MEQLQHINALFNFLQRDIEIQGFCDDLIQLLLWNIIAEECRGDCLGDILQAEVFYIDVKVGGKL